MADPNQKELRKFVFLHLPPEVRLKIYHYLHISPAPITKTEGPTKRIYLASLSSQLLRCNSTIKKEALPILLSKNNFTLDSGGDINKLRKMVARSSHWLYHHLICSDAALTDGLDIEKLLTHKRANQLRTLPQLRSFTYTELCPNLESTCVGVQDYVMDLDTTFEFTAQLRASHSNNVDVTLILRGKLNSMVGTTLGQPFLLTSIRILYRLLFCQTTSSSTSSGLRWRTSPALWPTLYAYSRAKVRLGESSPTTSTMR